MKMRAEDRYPRRQNQNKISPAQRRVVELVRALRREDTPERRENLAAAVKAVGWGPFGAFFVTRRESGAWWTGESEKETTLWANRRVVLRVCVPSGTRNQHEPELVLAPSREEAEAEFVAARERRRRDQRRASAAAAEARQIIRRASTFERTQMFALVEGERIQHIKLQSGWGFDGRYLFAPGEAYRALPARAAVQTLVWPLAVEAAKEDARARAAGVARIGRAVAEAAWQAICLRREEEALEAVRNLRRIHA